MRRYLAGLVTGVVLATAASAWADHTANGNMYRGLPEELRVAYAQGLYDGLVQADYLYARTDSTWLEVCIEVDAVTPSQLTWAFDDYLDEHPRIWHYPAPMLFVRALASVCGGGPQFKDID